MVMKSGFSSFLYVHLYFILYQSSYVNHILDLGLGRMTLIIVQGQAQAQGIISNHRLIT